MKRCARSAIRKIGLAGTAVLLLVGATGCSTRVFKVDSIKSPDVAASGPAFEIVNANPERGDGDPMVAKAAAYVKTAMSSKGMYEAPEGVPANMSVEVDFGSEAPRREVVQIEEPVYRMVREPGYYVTETYVDDKGNTRTITRYVQGEAREVFMGWRDRSYVVVVYPKYIRITAREIPEGGDDRPPREVWSVYVTNEDEEASMDKSLPLLVAAAMDAIDQNGSSERTVRLGEDDERVVFIKRGME